MKKLYLSLTIISLCFMMVACGKEKYEPQPINPDVDICVVCKMAIKDDQYATQIITKDGQSLKFDDLGDLNKWKTENGTDNIGATFVRDFYSLEWIKYEEAVYVYDESVQTPMAYGIVSFEKEEDAKKFIAEHQVGTLMTVEELSHHSWKSNREHKHKGEGHGDQAHESNDMMNHNESVDMDSHPNKDPMHEDKKEAGGH